MKRVLCMLWTWAAQWIAQIVAYWEAEINPECGEAPTPRGIKPAPRVMPSVRAAPAANVLTFRPRTAPEDAARAENAARSRRRLMVQTAKYYDDS